MAHHHFNPTDYNRAFAIGIILNLGFVVVEAVYGVLSDSLALIADAGHNLSDVISLLLAWAATRLARTKPTERLTYGLKRTTILAPLFSAILLLMALGAMTLEAAARLNEPTNVQGLTMVVVALAGVAVNAGTAALFAQGHKHDLNIKGAYIHMLADAAVSLGVVIAGIAIFYTGWFWLDPVISLFIVVVILRATWYLLRDSFNLAVDAVPENIDPTQVKKYLLGLPGVASLHDLHIWGMSSTDAALTVHLIVPRTSANDKFLNQVARDLHKRFGIGHSTIQIEHGDIAEKCALA